MRQFNTIVLAAAMAVAAMFAGCKKDDSSSSKTYTVTFNSNGGREVDPQTVAEGGTATEPTIPAKDDYIFAGWFTDDETFIYRWDFGTSTVTADTVLFAKWLEVIDISTPDDLDKVRTNLSCCYILMNDVSLAEYSAGQGWTPIGTDNVSPFTGIFDGNGHTITGLTINRPDDWYVGLFGYIDGGSVRNLGIEIAAGGIIGGACIGAIAGWVDGRSTITECCITGNISASDYFGGHYGGIAGYINRSTIANCYTIVDIKGRGVSGGIAGDVDGCTITDCYSAGNIFGSSGYSYSGGIVASINGNSTITNCVAINPKINATYGAGRITASISNYDDPVTVSNNFALDVMAVTGNQSWGNSGVSKTLEQLQTRETYSDPVVGDGQGGLGWAFGNSDDAPWKMPSGGGFPILYWQ